MARIFSVTGFEGGREYRITVNRASLSRPPPRRDATPHPSRYNKKRKKKRNETSPMIRAGGPGQNSRRGMAHSHHNYAHAIHARADVTTATRRTIVPFTGSNMIHGQFQNTTFRQSRASCAISTRSSGGGGGCVRSGVFAPGYRDDGEPRGSRKPISGRASRVTNVERSVSVA